METEKTDFIVTIHALERMAERFPDVIAGMNDKQQADLIHGEVMEALEAGRQSAIAPTELANFNRNRWVPAGSGSSYVWTPGKIRGYVLQENEEGMLVVTVLTRND